MYKVEATVMDLPEIRELAKKAYGIEDFNVAETEERQNGTYLLFDVEKGPGDYEKENEQAEISSIRGGYVPLYRTGLFLNLLCEDGHLEPGKYLIDVSW